MEFHGRIETIKIINVKIFIPCDSPTRVSGKCSSLLCLGISIQKHSDTC